MVAKTYIECVVKVMTKNVVVENLDGGPLAIKFYNNNVILLRRGREVKISKNPF